MSKSKKRAIRLDGDLSDHKIKVQKKIDDQRKIADNPEDYLDDENYMNYMNDPKFYRALKEYR